MGSGVSGGYSNTKGASSKDALVKQLEQSGTKFSKDNMVFVTKDKTGQVVWLEKGHLKMQGDAEEICKIYEMA